VKLIWKFNIVLAVIFLFAFAVAAAVAHYLLQANAKEEILRTARLMMEAAGASRDYTTTQIKPLLETQLKYVFLPETIPAFAATEQFNELRKSMRILSTRKPRSIPPIRATARAIGRRTSSTISGSRRRRRRRPASAIRPTAARYFSRGRSRSSARPVSNATAPSTSRRGRCSTFTAPPTASAGS
jgi:hypothetical protein